MPGPNRPPAVAGRFYPDQPRRLRRQVRSLLDAAAPPRLERAPKALIVPHAGYRYSGPIAASAYAGLLPFRDRIHRVVLLGTAHSNVSGLAGTEAASFETPLGLVPIDHDVLRLLDDLPQVVPNEAAHAQDHALEVQLPFLQESLDRFRLVPFLVGLCRPEEVAEVLERLWNGPETLIVISSDLSHYLDAEAARARDQATAEAITALDPARLGTGQACGHRAIAGLLLQARRHGLTAHTLDLRHSGDTGGPAQRVVGYGAFVFV